MENDRCLLGQLIAPECAKKKKNPAGWEGKKEDVDRNIVVTAAQQKQQGNFSRALPALHGPKRVQINRNINGPADIYIINTKKCCNHALLIGLY